MNRVGKASTMSVPEMRDLLGLKKTESYWLLKKNYFDVTMVGGKMRIVIESFERWYAGQVHYHKVNGPAPGAVLRKDSYSVADICEMLKVSSDTVYTIIRREGLSYTIHQNGHWRVNVEEFETWYASQSRYRKQEERARDKFAEENSMSIPEFGRSLGLNRNEAYKLVRQIKDELQFIQIADRTRITLASYIKWRESAEPVDKTIADILGVSYGKCDPDETPCNEDDQRPLKEIQSRIAAKSIFTIQEAAEILRLHEKAVYRLIDYGDLKGFRIKGKWRIQQTEMLRWVEEQTESPKEGQ